MVEQYVVGTKFVRGGALEARGYKFNPRFVDELHNIGGVFVDNIAARAGGLNEMYDGGVVLYEGAVHQPKDLSQKLPNMLILGPVHLNNGTMLYGSTFGHEHTRKGGETYQEIYEFTDGYSALLTTSRDGVRISWANLTVGAPGTKTPVSGTSTMTLFSLEPARCSLLSDMANPLDNPASKDVMKAKGAMMALYKSRECPLEIYLNSKYAVFGIDNDVVIPLSPKSEKAEDIAQALIEAKDMLWEKYKIQIREAQPSIRCVGPRGSGDIILDGSLEEMARSEAKKLHKLLGLPLTTL